MATARRAPPVAEQRRKQLLGPPGALRYSCCALRADLAMGTPQKQAPEGGGPLSRCRPGQLGPPD
eukprot:6780165-Alexandrium_andersonii.AAC.1